MKTMKIILAGVLLMLPLLCQAQKNLFNKYGDMKGVSSVYISKAMIETNPNLFTKDVYIGKVSGQLNSVQVLSTMDNNVKKEMRKDLRSLVQSSRYELLMKQKGTVSSSEFYMSRKGEKVKELIMIVDGAATLKFVYLEGDMTLKDIQNIMMYQNTSWNGNNVNIQLPDINWAEIEKLKNRDWLGELKHSQELALKGLENVAKLKDNKYLKEQMDTDTWKRFEKSMEALEERLEKMELEAVTFLGKLANRMFCFSIGKFFCYLSFLNSAKISPSSSSASSGLSRMTCLAASRPWAIFVSL